MATPFTPDRLVSILRAEGVRVVEYGSWRTHNRNHKGAFGPINGVMVHHTVSSGTDASVRLCYDGYADLPGPLCHGVIAKDGTVYLISSGRANHAGGGDPGVLAAVVDERSLPATHKHEGSAGAADGNSHFYGFECVNLGDGKDPWPAAQLDAIERVSAAICRAYGWSAASVIGHKEWSDWKSDPKGFAMADMRARIGRRLGSKPTNPTPPAKQYEPFPGVAWFKKNPRSPVVTAMGRRLVAVGCSAYSQGPGPQWTESDRQSYARWQRHLGHSGDDADGWPGAASWAALKVPKV
ncbi:peptidoglycan-binding protein [Streptomyces sp. ASQP_92]|uniref:peptidoglycan-binding protein n=1 Tax=Streptomyces sp. ASQP_92 TaxID=2979116 RepID=UPI0021BE68F4|nr:peptidoglycan-binding protein [Streptomyces sp. ASQP_92]MCT9090580.1 peptidoglycan-binding protein [Streptomyces sp. ASQP_92]